MATHSMLDKFANSTHHISIDSKRRLKNRISKIYTRDSLANEKSCKPWEMFKTGKLKFRLIPLVCDRITHLSHYSTLCKVELNALLCTTCYKIQSLHPLDIKQCKQRTLRGKQVISFFVICINSRFTFAFLITIWTIHPSTSCLIQKKHQAIPLSALA